MIASLDALLGKLGQGLQEICWLLFRVLASSMFMTHGLSKLFGDNPQAMQSGGMTTVNIENVVVFAMPIDINALYVAGVIELFGGLLIALGLLTRLMALLATLLMLMAYLTAHFAWFPTLNNGELAAMYFLAYLIIFCFGPGQLSIDAWLSIRRQGKQQQKMDKMIASIND